MILRLHALQTKITLSFQVDRLPKGVSLFRVNSVLPQLGQLLFILIIPHDLSSINFLLEDSLLRGIWINYPACLALAHPTRL